MEIRSKGITVDSGGETEAGTVKTAEMYVEGYKASLVKDTSRKGLWTVSFMRREF